MGDVFLMYDYSSSKSKGKGFWKMLGVLVIIFFMYCLITSSNWITEDKALERIKEIAKTDNVQIIRHTNLAIIFGDPYEATFEVIIDGKNYSATCTSGEFSEMTCRLYTDEVK